LKYRITHSTLYHYSQSVGLCQSEAKLQPRNFWRQHCHSSYFDISPKPIDFRERSDFFGNRVAYFAIQQSHSKLIVTSISEVSLYLRQHNVDLVNPIKWEQVRNFLQGHSQSQTFLTQSHESILELIDARQYLLDSPMITIIPDLADYAKISFHPGRSLIEVVYDLVARIHKDFTYDPASTSIATPLSEVISLRRGVCQDFAHLAIGCLRAYGIAARYISGYVETLPEKGKPRLVGADASHAWFSVYIPGTGWLDFDPTNNTMPIDQHITLAWGRDYADVTPLKGIAFGGGQHTLSVSVDVLRLK